MLNQIWEQLLDKIKEPDTQLQINDMLVQPLLKMISDHVRPYVMLLLGLFIVNLLLLIIVTYKQFFR